MHVDIRKSEDVVIVDLKGKLTAGLGDQILRETIHALLAEGWKKIVLNLSDVTTLDSAGLGELVAGLRRCKAAVKSPPCLYIPRRGRAGGAVF